MRTFFFFLSKNRLSKILFSNPFPKKRWDCKSQKSGFVFDPKDPPRVWILWIHDPFLDLPPKKPKSVSGFRNPVLDFPKKTHPKCRYFYWSVHVVVELSSNIMRGNWGFRWRPKNALLWQITRDQNLIGMDQTVVPCVTLFQFEKDTFGLWLEHCSKKKSRKGSNCPQMRLFTRYKNISPLTIINVSTDAIRELKQGRFEPRASTGNETYFL